MKKILFFLLAIVVFPASSICTAGGFDQKDRERLIRLENKLEIFMKQTDKRLEQMDRRITDLQEDMNERFTELREDMNKRFAELREDMNKRFELTDKRIIELREDMNKRFEVTNKRMAELREDMNKRFEEMMNFLWMITAIFTTLTVAVIGFAYWDRRTIIRKAKEETIEEVEKEGRLKDLIKALRELARHDKRLAEVLKSFNLL